MKTNTENFLVANNIDMSVICECDSEDSHYALVKINLLGRNTYCICVLGDGYAFECLGESEEAARKFFEIASKSIPAPDQVFDIVTDMRREQIYC